jgi:MoxR-like ATPase
VNIDGVKSLAGRIRAEVAKAVIGQDETVSLLLCALFSRGHVLLEGVPGVAKTLLARAFARAVGLGSGRIQFTPDLMPGDIIGSNLFDFRTNTFNLVKGPIFNELILADEINRTPPKTQAALLEAMQERSVTIDGTRHQLSPWFIVVATQNPIEHQGTYALPEAQLDRFLFKHVLGYPSEAEEMKIVAAYGARPGSADPAAMGVEVAAGHAVLDEAATCVSSVRMTDEVLSYIVNLVRGTRVSADLTTGASPRAGALLASAARARAALDGRDFTIPDDVKQLAVPALRHRCVLSPAAEVEGRTSDQALAAVIERIEAPR